MRPKKWHCVDAELRKSCVGNKLTQQSTPCQHLRAPAWNGGNHLCISSVLTCVTCVFFVRTWLTWVFDVPTCATCGFGSCCMPTFDLKSRCVSTLWVIETAPELTQRNTTSSLSTSPTSTPNTSHIPLPSMAYPSHSETPPAENKGLFAALTGRTYAWIVPNWTLQQKLAISTERQVQQIAYQRKLWVSPSYETAQTRRSVLLGICCKVQFGTIRT